MKYLIITLAALFFAVASQHQLNGSPEVGGIIENTINTTLNRIRANLSDPITVSSENFDFGEGESLSGTFNITSGRISGIKDFVATKIKVEMTSQRINMTIVLPELEAQFKYFADITLLNLVPLYGHGRMSVIFDEVQIEVEGAADLKDGPKIKDVELLISLSEATFDLKGLIDNPEYSALISTALTDNFANFVNHNSKIISDTISPILETIVNSFLEPESNNIHVTTVKVFVR